MIIKVVNGKRVPVEFVRPGGGYSGPAAIEDDRVLFRGSKVSMRGIKAGVVDGRPVQVLSVEPSENVPSIVVVTVAFDGGAE